MTVTAEIDALAAGTVPVTFAFNGETRRVDAALTAGKNEVSADFEVEIRSSGIRPDTGNSRSTRSPSRRTA